MSCVQAFLKRNFGILVLLQLLLPESDSFSKLRRHAPGIESVDLLAELDDAGVVVNYRVEIINQVKSSTHSVAEVIISARRLIRSVKSAVAKLFGAL